MLNGAERATTTARAPSAAGGRMQPRLVLSHPHGNANVRRFEGWRIVDAVSRHGDDITQFLEKANQAQLLLGDDASEDAHPP